MTPIQRAQQEWVANTKPFCKDHFYENGKWQGTDQFRQFDKAIALLNWNEDCIEILKLETLQPRQGGPTRLICFLKCLADRYKISLWGHARLYKLDPPFPEGRLLTKEELFAFYERQGFQLRTIDADTCEIKYIPKTKFQT
jgi:hypothetical protein